MDPTSLAGRWTDALRRLCGSSDGPLRQAAWVARCVGRGDQAPLRATDVETLADVLVQRHPAIAWRWMSSIALRLSTSQARILGLLGRSLAEQVAQLLLDEAEGGKITLTQKTTAAMLGAQRPSVNAIFKRLQDQELIIVGYGFITITNPSGLARTAGGGRL